MKPQDPQPKSQEPTPEPVPAQEPVPKAGPTPTLPPTTQQPKAQAQAAPEPTPGKPTDLPPKPKPPKPLPQSLCLQFGGTPSLSSNPNPRPHLPPRPNRKLNWATQIRILGKPSQIQSLLKSNPQPRSC